MFQDSHLSKVQISVLVFYLFVLFVSVSRNTHSRIVVSEYSVNTLISPDLITIYRNHRDGVVFSHSHDANVAALARSWWKPGNNAAYRQSCDINKTRVYECVHINESDLQT